MDSSENIKDNFPICQHCLQEIKDDNFCCPACGMFYHKGCWEKGNGCAVLSCSQKNILLNPLFQSSIPVKELLIHIEYLLNIRKYMDAINECSRIIAADKSNTQAKIYYNKAVSALNIKMKILDSAEGSFRRKEYKAASMFYTDYLKYCDEEEGEFIRSKIKYLDELLPKLKRRNYVLNVLYGFIVFIILCAAGFLAYQFIYLKEDTEFAEIERNDDYTDIKSMETQVSRYEKFLAKYYDGKMKDAAVEKIRKISVEIASKIHEEDWRSAMVYLSKLDSKDVPITYAKLYKDVMNSAGKEISALRNEAKEFDFKRMYPEAKERIEKSIAITERFQPSDFYKLKQTLLDNKNLLNKKTGLLTKFKDIEKEINTKSAELQSSNPEGIDENKQRIYGRVMKKSRDLVIIKSTEDKKLYALKNAAINYEIGDEIDIFVQKKGKIEVNDDALNTMILPVIYEIQNTGAEEEYINSINQRLNYLKGERAKIDSLLNLGI